MTYQITKENSNTTVKQFIKQKIKLSSKMLTRLKRVPDGILLNGERVTVRAIMKDGDVLTLNTDYEESTSDSITPTDVPLQIIYEDEYYIALNKSAGTPTHPSHDHYYDTLANGIARLYQERNIPFVFRAVNRLDKDTSGIVVFAKSAISAAAFSDLQQKHQISKKYIAIVKGKLSGKGCIKGYIRRKDNSVMLREFSLTQTHGDAMFSHTDYESIISSEELSLINLTLHTGRTHQIRVHLSSIGHPILGDGLYGSEEDHKRHYLHAYLMIFTHPFTKKQILLEAKPPEEFKTLIRNTGIKYE